MLWLFALMARKPKNPINDIINTTSAWLGGRRGAATNPQVRAAMDATRAVGKVVDSATGGFGQALISDAQRMAESGSSTPSALYKTAAVNLGAAAAGAAAAKVAGKVLTQTDVAGRVVSAGQSLLPKEIGIHHSVSKTGKAFTGEVLPSVAKRGVTAMDQVAGQSYMWTTKGLGGAKKAANEAAFQVKEIAEKYVTFPGNPAAVGYVTRVARGAAKADPNLPGSIARSIKGSQKVVKSVVGSGGPQGILEKSFTRENVEALTRAAQAAKLVEYAKSAAKIGGVAAGVVAAGSGVQKVVKKSRGGGKNKR